MSACEHCWSMSRLLGIEYHDQIERAEAEKSACTQDTIIGRRMRAGQWWDEATQKDLRDAAHDERTQGEK